MLLSRAALRRIGAALADGRMPLPRRGTPNDVHLTGWARRLGVRCAHSNLFWYSALPADARLVAVAARRVGRDLGDYVADQTAEGRRARREFATAVFTELRGALEPQVLGAVVLHRVPAPLMYAIHKRLVAHQNSSGGSVRRVA